MTHKVDQGGHINTSGESLSSRIPKMPPWMPSAPFRPVQFPTFQRLFSHFTKLFRHLLQLLPLKSSSYLVKLVAAFKNALYGLFSNTNDITYRRKFDRGDRKPTNRADRIDGEGQLIQDGDPQKKAAMLSEDDSALGEQEHITFPENQKVVTANVMEEDPTPSPANNEEYLEERDSGGEVSAAYETPTHEETHFSEGMQDMVGIRKRALLIGVRNNRVGPENAPVPDGPAREHRDVQDMRSLLEDVYDYDPNNIISLVDDGHPEHIQPTRENIVLQIEKLIEDAKEKDRFFFHFAGHSEQEDTDDEEEEDRKNEYIVTSDGQKIMDDELKRRLVDPLPSTCSLTAVFDSCHSCSLLGEESTSLRHTRATTDVFKDLPHFRCNQVYVPWLNRGIRRTDTIWAKNQRKLECDDRFEHLDLDTNLPNNMRHKAILGSPLGRRATELPIISEDAIEQGSVLTGRPKAIRRPQILTSTLSEPGTVPSPSPSSARHFASPICIYCHGNCRKDPIFMKKNVPTTDVICLSSSKDSQLTWVREKTMTQFLVKILRDQPKRTLKDVLTIVSHDIHRSYIDMHDESRDYKREVKEYEANPSIKRSKKKKFQPKKVEMHNFQDPQISSFWPLDMNRYFEP